MTACKWNPTLGYRVLARGDADEPCPHRHCCVCWRGHCDDTTPQTCPECVGVVREDLTAVVDLHDRLEDQAVHTHSDGRLNTGPLGGDAMVMLAPGSDARARVWARERGDQREAEGRSRGAWGDVSHAADEVWNDPIPPLLLLATHEDDWRNELGHPRGPLATVWRCADYLGQHLTMMAQRHPAFEEFAADLARCRARLEDVLSEGERDETGAPCMAVKNDRECNTPLVKVYGRSVAQDHWRCPRCRTRYSAAEYLLAVKEDYRKNADAMPAEHIAEEFEGVTANTLRVWATRGKVRRRGQDGEGRVLYDVADVERHAQRRGEDVA